MDEAIEYVRKTLRDSISNPKIFCRAVNRFVHNRFTLWEFNQNGVNVLDEDWDNLILLDACRYDIFASNSNLPGRLESRISRASDTSWFLKANFRGKNLHDTVYIDANGQLYHRREELGTELHAVNHLWADEWDSELGTVHPDTVTEHALRASEEFPRKRLFIHYVQPHYPFIGSELAVDREIARDPERAFWPAVFNGELEIPPDQLRSAYIENLLLVLPYVEKLMKSLDGKTVVTADHGNMLGERAWPIPIREWGHPQGIYTRELTKVPWLVFEDGPRKDIVPEPPITESDQGIDRDLVETRLRHLGYYV